MNRKARKLAVSHQTPGECEYCDKLYNNIRDAFLAEYQDELNWLSALEEAGVDNWEGYDHAVKIYNGEDPFG